MKCNSINPELQKVCDDVPGKRYCQFCEGTSGLPREKEEAYLIQLGSKNGLVVQLKENNDSKTKELPSLWQQAKNLGKAVVKHAANLFQIAPDSVIEMRKSICDSCDKLNAERRCSECGCYVDVKTKWASEECPLKKWMAYAAEKQEDLGELKKGGCNCGR